MSSLERNEHGVFRAYAAAAPATHGLLLIRFCCAGRRSSVCSTRNHAFMPRNKSADLIDPVRELQIKLAKEIDRSRRLRERMGVSEEELKASGQRMARLLARMRTKRTVH
jgi:hypothetical protein